MDRDGARQRKRAEFLKLKIAHNLPNWQAELGGEKGRGKEGGVPSPEKRKCRQHEWHITGIIIKMLMMMMCMPRIIITCECQCVWVCVCERGSVC